MIPRLSLGAAAGLGIVIATALNAAGVFTEDDIHWVNLFLGFGFALLWAGLVFGLLAPWARGASGRAWRAGLVCAVLGVLTVAAFWSGLPPVLGMAGVYLGLSAYSHRLRIGAVAAGIGVLAIVLDVVAYGTDIASRL